MGRRALRVTDSPGDAAVSKAPPRPLMTRSEVMETLKRSGLVLKKALGQNFLADPDALQRILEALDLGPDDGVLEVGPGIGTMTRALAERAGVVAAIEYDPRFLPILEKTLEGAPPVQIIHADVLKADLRALLLSMDTRRRKVAANLPYYITTPALTRFLECRDLLERVVVLVQKEVADRMAAAPGSGEYGSFSVFVQYHAEVEVTALVPPNAFVPPPKVTSAVALLRMRPRPPVDVTDEAAFFRVTRAAFGQRRKTLVNALIGGLGLPRETVETAARRAGLPPLARGETLGLEAFARLTDALLHDGWKA